MHLDYDVIVAGAGPGGATVARLCAQTGLRTLLVERERLPRYKACGGCLSLKSIQLLGFDLSPILENTVLGVKFTYCIHEPFWIKKERPIAFLVMRDRFDQFLIEKGLEAGVEILDGNKVIHVEEKGDGIEIELAKGERFHCEYLVGADGPESIVAKSLRLNGPRNDRGGVGLESEIPFESVKEFPKEDFSCIHLDFGGVPNGYGWVFPKREGLSIGIGGMFEKGKKVNPLKYYNAFIGKLPYLQQGGKVRVLGHPLPAFYGEEQKVSRGKVLLVGDAAHLMDPLMGEGIYYALKSGMLAAETILQSKEKGFSPSDLYQNLVRHELFENLKWALYFSRFVFRFTKMAYQTLLRYPELADLYLQVLEGKETYQGFVIKIKERIRDFLGGRLSEKIREAMTRI